MRCSKHTACLLRRVSRATSRGASNPPPSPWAMRCVYAFDIERAFLTHAAGSRPSPCTLVVPAAVTGRATARVVARRERQSSVSPAVESSSSCKRRVVLVSSRLNTCRRAASEAARAAATSAVRSIAFWRETFVSR